VFAERISGPRPTQLEAKWLASTPDLVAVDTTGASDAFTTAVYAANLLAGAPPAGAIHAAQSAAALAIGHPGGQESMPTLSGSLRAVEECSALSGD
jgi:sugar/nucleoside kinase (ribokinase family)